MNRTVIAKGGGFQLISIGNGTAYELGLNGADNVVFVQGDDAIKLYEDWQGFEENFPHMHTAGLLQKLWVYWND